MWQLCVKIMANVSYAISSKCIFPLLLRIESEKAVPDFGNGSFLSKNQYYTVDTQID
jgi:hypothetical protein